MIFFSFCKKLIILNVLFIIAFFSINVHADENHTLFNENWAFNFFVKYNMGIFSDLNQPQHRTNKPFDIGIGIRYKTFSAQLSVPILFTGLFKDLAFDFEMDSFLDNIYIEAYFKNYPNFFIEDTNKRSELSIHSSGIKTTFIHNHENHNLSSVISLDKKQNISSGSLLYGFGVFHSSIYSADGTLSRYNDRQHLLYFGPSAGYSYTWIMGKSIFLNSSILLHTDLGVNVNNSKWFFTPQLEPKIVVGHHNNKWSANLVMKNNAKFQIWNRDEMDILTLVSVKLMFSKRF